MKVLYMMSSLQIGGGETIAVGLLPHLKRLGLDMTLLTMNTWRDDPGLLSRFHLSGLPREDLAARRLIDRTAIRSFFRLLRTREFDLIHATDQDTIILSALAHRLTGVPALITRHVMDEPTGTRKEALRAKLVIASMRHGCNKVICVSDAVKHHLERTYGVPGRLLETVHNGIEIERFDTLGSRRETRAKLGWRNEDVVVIMVAMLRRPKGHDILLSAAPEILALDDNIRIKVVGKGELDAELRSRVSAFGGRVELMGERQDVPALLGASDLLVLPSRTEALPTVLIEAGAVGLPVVATDVGGTREIVVDGETGIITKPDDPRGFADAVVGLLSNRDLASRLGRQASARVRRKFTLEAQARSTADLYRRIPGRK